MKKIKCVIICAIIIASIIPAIEGLDQPFPVYGYIKDSNGNAVINAEVIVKDLTRNKQMSVYTDESGYYQADLFNLPECQNGDLIEIYCSYKNEDNNKTFTLNTSLPSKNISFNLIGIPYAITKNASEIRNSSANLNGELIYLNDTSCQVWFEYGETISYGFSTTKNTYYGTTNFSITISGLNPDKLYHFRVVAKNSRKTFYGNDLTFITSSDFPEVITNDASNISYNSAELNGYLSKVGASSCNVWFVYDTISHSNIDEYGYRTSNISKTSSSYFSSKVTGLEVNKTYYFRAVAGNIKGISIGEEKTFTTQIVIPKVSTISAENITSNSTSLKGRLDDNGGEICDVWFEYGETTSYGYATEIMRISSGDFSINISNLIPGKLYHFRAVAKNSKGLAYGIDKTFKTNSTKATIETSFPNYAVILSANLIDTGGENCYVWFEYWKEGGEVYATEEKIVSEQSVVQETISGLEGNTRYYYRACVRNSQGISYGTNFSFLTSSLPSPPAVVTGEAVPSFNNVTLFCNVSLGENDFCYVWFEIWNDEKFSSQVIIAEENESLSCLIENLEDGMNYSYRAIAVGSNGRIAYGDTKFFSTLEKENHPPSVVLIFPENNSLVNAETSLSGEIYDEDGDMLIVKFYLNDGEVATFERLSGIVSINISLEYGKNYNWSLEVSDGKNISCSQKFNFRTINILQADFNNSISFENEITYFNDTSSGETISWLWNFGDGIYSYERNTTHIYSEKGIYIVNLTISDAYGKTYSKEKEIIVYSRGDANMDGGINSLDITKIERIIARIDEATPPADLDNNGEINSEDLYALIKKILEI